MKIGPSTLVTGSCGLIGSEVCSYFHRLGFQITGIDSNHRVEFFGADGDTSWMRERLREMIPGYRHVPLDIRDREGVLRIIEELRPNLIVHTAAQPSHDLAASIPFLDFEVNAVGTLNLLEATRRFCPETPFVFTSTNKVYGDKPNEIHLKELETRWTYDDPRYANGIPESFGIDQCKHSLFGASKVAADVLVQEYGRYFGIPTCCLRAGCLTGPNHSGVELHGFLSYLVKTNLEGKVYRIFGYKGKQVRDNIHAEDVASLIHEFYQNPRVGAVYNLGGGERNSCSILEAFSIVEQITGNRMHSVYEDEPRIGDHICYFSDLTLVESHYPNWRLSRSLPAIFEEICKAWQMRLAGRN